MPRFEGHIWVYNSSGHTCDVTVVGDGDTVKVPFGPGHNTVINFTAYNGNDLFPPTSAIADITVVNRDNAANTRTR